MLVFLYTLIIYPLVQIIEVAYTLVHKIFGVPGISIIGVSFAVTLLCLPLYVVAERWQKTERATAQKLAVRAKKIKQVFKGDEQYMILSTYYRQNHYHPIYALRSSLGILIQIPFFIAAYSYLSHLEALQGASFLFIRDLGKPDALLSTGGGGGLISKYITYTDDIDKYNFRRCIYTRFGSKRKNTIIRDGGGIFGAAIQFTGGACVVLDNEQCTFALQKYFLQTKKFVKNILYFILRLGIYANYISFIYK